MASDAVIRAARFAGGDVVTGDPGLDLGGVEAKEVSPLDERHAALGDESSNVADRHAETLGDLGDVPELGWLVVCGHRGSSIRRCDEQAEMPLRTTNAVRGVENGQEILHIAQKS